MSNLKQVPEMPTAGQFVAMWVFNGKPFSMVFKYEGGVLLEYSSLPAEWTPQWGMERMLARSTFYVVSE